MANQSMYYKKSAEVRQQISAEFLDALLQRELSYPWNPADPEVETYFAESEQDFFLLHLPESEDFASQAETLFSYLQQCWNSATEC
ncbi:MAG: hypothetical protein ACRDEA_02705 [Microcystaceae cyanobacterium]